MQNAAKVLPQKGEERPRRRVLRFSQQSPRPNFLPALAMRSAWIVSTILCLVSLSFGINPEPYDQDLAILYLHV